MTSKQKLRHKALDQENNLSVRVVGSHLRSSYSSCELVTHLPREHPDDMARTPSYTRHGMLNSLLPQWKQQRKLRVGFVGPPSAEPVCLSIRLGCVPNSPEMGAHLKLTETLGHDGL